MAEPEASAPRRASHEAMPPRILLVGDEDSSLTRVQGVLLSWGYGVDRAADGQAALERSLILHPALVIADLGMPIVDGLGLLRALRAYQPEIPVVILTGSGGIETGLSAMQEGAYDCVTKPVDASRLRVVLERALEDGRARKELGRLRRQMRGAYGTGVLVGHSAAMQHVQRLIEMAAPTPAPVLITGETGTGKELVARTLHTLSARASGPFIAVNCSAIPETLLEGEMFGHEKGAFTGAFERRAGCFEVAHGGTIFLDEVAEMSPATQAKLLRVLEQGAVRRVGAKSELKVDVRVLAATNKDPATAIKEGALREDLYYRLNVLNIALPPLRERNEDIPLLVEEFIREFDTKYEKRIKGVDDEALQLLRAHPWPGNVRELRNTIERAIIACPGDVVTASGLRPGPVRRRAAASERGDTITVSLGAPLRDVEREVILGTLAWANDNKTRAAQILGISQKTLYNKLRAYNHGADGSFGRGDQPLSD